VECGEADLVVGDVGVLPGLGQQAVVPEDGAVVEPTESLKRRPSIYIGTETDCETKAVAWGRQK
jgi:hypothetical protein